MEIPELDIYITRHAEYETIDLADGGKRYLDVLTLRGITQAVDMGVLLMNGGLLPDEVYYASYPPAARTALEISKGAKIYTSAISYGQPQPRDNLYNWMNQTLKRPHEDKQRIPRVLIVSTPAEIDRAVERVTGLNIGLLSEIEAGCIVILRRVLGALSLEGWIKPSQFKIPIVMERFEKL
ncbi:MAG TPA: hypothetical protein VGA08_01845 [Candidatus Saccharimonadales bacterium]